MQRLSALEGLQIASLGLICTFILFLTDKLTQGGPLRL